MKNYFYKRPNGEVFSCGEEEAFNVEQMIKTGFKYERVGVSDAKIFMEEVGKLADLKSKKINFLKQRASSISFEEYEAEKAIIEDEYKLAYHKAFAEEVERARGNVELPRDFSRVDISGKPTTIEQLGNNLKK